MLLGLGGLFAGMGVLDLQDAAHLVVGIILHPAVGIPHLRDTAHAVVGVLHPLAGVVRGSGQLMQEIQFEGSRAQPVGHLLLLNLKKPNVENQHHTNIASCNN